ncbi:Copia protein [Durusdinium trenchii]|uniref:Copia protein n=1 Tax=Durusdinium trenchii TaxID=1381693 RepID=A0ABP0J3U2_9DINO
MVNFEMKDLQALPKGIFGTMDGGASCMVLGHDTLMNYIEHFHKEIDVSCFKFRPATKAMQFGGDRTMEAQWTVRMLVSGSTPLLIGRPILKAMKIQLNFLEDTMSVDGSPWKKIVMGPRGEHLLQLDEGLESIPENGSYEFDFMMEETFHAVTLLSTTWSSREEQAMHAQENQQNDTDSNETSDPEDDDDDTNTCYRRTLTDKLVRSFRVHQQHMALRHKMTIEQALASHAKHEMQFWEIYAGDAILATKMQELGFKVRTFALLSGWDFTKPAHQREFIQLYYHCSPEIAWLAPPCTKWSPLQRLNARTPAAQQRLEAQQQHEEGTHLRFSKTIHNKQYKQDRISIFEHPKYATSWETPTLQQLEGYDAHVDQCQYGATLPDNNGDEQYIRKPTTLRVTHEQLAAQLHRVCTDERYHLPIEGSSPLIGNRAAAAGSYNANMCREWASILYDFMHHNYWPYDADEQAYPAETEQQLQPQTTAAAAEQQLQPATEEDEYDIEELGNNSGILTRLQETQLAAAKRTVDDRRGWASEQLRTRASDHGTELEISPDHDPNMPHRERIIQALNYVIPQINNTPNVQGFSATQWAMGAQPRIPGVLMDHDLTPAQLTPSEAMQAKLTLQKQAAIAVIEADNDARLRRALLRQHQAIQYVYHTGQRVFYWRDAPGGAGPKLRWKGPAIVVMTEEGRTGPATNTYWVTHGTTLLRVSGEHLRPDLNHQDDTDPIIRAKNALDQIRGRSTTLYTDLQKTNKRKRSEVVTEDEDDTEMTPAPPETTTATAPEQPQDHWDVEEDGITWHRIHVVPRQALYVPSGDSQAPHEHFQDLRRTTILRPGQPQRNRTVLQDDWRLPDASRSMPFSWTGTTTFILRTDRRAPPGDDDVPMEQQPTASPPPTAGTEGHGNNPEPTTGSTTTGIMSPAMPPGDPPAAASAEHAGRPPSSSGEPEPPPSVLGDATHDDQVIIPEHRQAVYSAPERQESFRERRSRYDKQETLSFYTPTDNRVRYGPNKEPFETLRTSPYSKPKAPDPEEALTMSTYDADLTKADNMTLPPGWKLENGYLTLDECRDEWTLYGDKLVRRHYLPRNKLFDPTSKGANCPLPAHYLSKDRQTLGAGNINKYDRWKQKKDEETTHSWTGRTVFKVLPAFRLLAKEAFYNASQGHQTYIEPRTEQAEHMPMSAQLSYKEKNIPAIAPCGSNCHQTHDACWESTTKMATRP